LKFQTEQYYHQYKDAVMEAIGENKMTCQEMSKKLDVHYNRIKWVMFRLRNEDHLSSYKYNDITYYLKPKPHPLQSIFGHEVKFTEDQIKGSQVYNEKDAKHNARHNHTQDSFYSSSIISDGVNIGK
jgi:transcription initiation factor IIE alpha subunit